MQEMEFAILDWIQANMRCEALDLVMPVITDLSKAGLIWILAGFLMFLNKKYRLCGLTELLSLGIGTLTCNILLKNLIARPRPIWLNPDIEMLVRIPTDYSFPSGHTTASFAAATVLLYYDRRFGIPALILACLIAFSRLYLYVHFLSDVLCGLVLGIAVGLFSIWLVKKILIRRSR